MHSHVSIHYYDDMDEVELLFIITLSYLIEKVQLHKQEYNLVSWIFI